MHFSLRATFIIVTTVAVYTAIHAAMFRMAPMSGMAISLGVNAAAQLPVFLVWTIAALWVFDRRQQLKGSRLVLIALLLEIAWRPASEAISMIAYRFMQSSPGTMGGIFFARSILDMAIKTAAWSMLLIAYI